MKKNRVIALALCGALVCGIGGAAAVTSFAAAGSDKAETTEAVVTAAPTDAAQSRSETVYVIANADGSAKKVIVSDRFENATRDEAQTAMAGLSNVENVKGDDCWQGTTDKELPVQMHISYTLDGKAVTAEELAGQSGHVVIRYDYENRQTALAMVDGRQETLYVPFAVLTGTVLDSDRFSHVEVTNGKLVNDGNRMAVVGLSFPGLQENLTLDTDRLEIPSYVEIEADVTDFQLETTLSVVSSSVWSSLDKEQLDELDLGSLGDDLDKLTDAMDQLMDGSAALYDGLDTLLTKSGELSGGVTQLADGLNQLAANNATLNGGAKQVFDSLLAMANTQIAAAGLDVPQLTIDNYAAVLDGVLSQLGGAGDYAEGVAREKVEQAVRAQKDKVRDAVIQAVQPEVTAKVTEAVQEVVWQKVLAAAGLTQETYNAGVAAGMISATQQAQLKAALDQQMASEAVQQQIEKTTADQMASDEVSQLVEAKTEEQIQLLIEQQMASAEVQQQIGTAKEQASAGAASLQSLKSQLDSYRTFYNGVVAYTAGVASARDGAVTLQDNMPALIDGVTQLRDGAKTLSDGMKQFNEEGVQKLVEAFDGDLSALASRLRATVDVARDYQSFADEGADMDGAVRFVYRTEAIEAE